MFWMGITIGSFVAGIIVFILVSAFAGSKISELRAKIYKQQEYICCHCHNVPFGCNTCEYNYMKEDE